MKNIREKVDNVISIINKKIKSSKKELIKFCDLYDEYILFGNKQKFAKEKNNMFRQKNIYQMNCLIKYILVRINKFEKIVPDKIELSYNCYFDGDDTLYYNDYVFNYSDEEFTQILLNHIFHYFCNYNNTRVGKRKQLSYMLLCFDCAGFIDGIAYSQSKRYALYDYFPEKEKEVIIFQCKNSNSTNIFVGIAIHITKTYISFKNFFNLDQYNNDVINFLQYNKKLIHNLCNEYYEIKKYMQIV